MANEENRDFNVESSGSGAYKDFIEGLRRLFGRRSSHNRPVCVEQDQDQPIAWEDITLRTNTHSIRIRIRTSNLYLDGYQILNQQGQPMQSFEFNNDAMTNLFPGSTFLGFTGHYTHLEKAAGQEMQNITLGQQQLIHAVNQLATTNDRQTRARSLIVVIQMICESMRLIPITKQLIENYHSGTNILPWMLEYERSWGSLSAFLLRADAWPDVPFSLPGFIPEDVVALLGILLGLCYRGPHSSGRIPRAVVDHEQCLLGRPLVEVFSVIVNNIDGETPGHLYGTVLVTEGLGFLSKENNPRGFQYIFNRSKGNDEYINPGEAISLSGPSRSMLAYDSFTIDAALFDHDTFSWDDEVSKDQIAWDVYDITKEYDKPLSTKLKGKYGSVNVNYMVLSDAVAARVLITLKDGDGENPAQVYGDINTRIGDLNNETHKTVLFQQTKSNLINVREGNSIQLRRNVVAVPTNSSLKVIAKLYDYDYLSFDDEIANGTAVFSAQLSGSSTKNIKGKYGYIEVTINWNLDI